MLLLNENTPFLHRKRLEKSSKTGFTGPETGLTFILNTTTSDYYFSTGDFVGFKVQICSPTEFPDVQNGGLTQLFVDTNTKSYFKLIPTTIDSKRAIEQYSPIQRGCLFEHELFEQYAGHYSFVDCLLKCKLRNIITLCGCMPFFLPTNFPDGTVTPVKCTLAHNKCLERIRRNYVTHGLSFVYLGVACYFLSFPSFFFRYGEFV